MFSKPNSASANFIYPFGWSLTEEEIWDITVYLNNLTSNAQGGGQ